ncbi:MAG: hemerythrin domain-containing protein [Chloroflexi bacterium]|nr:hemerythrin domain-containing protein [Chloroflexota bacterium]
MERSLQQLLREHQGTHARLDRLLAALDRQPGSPEVRVVLDEFRAALPGHIAAEDDGLFPRLSQAFPERAALIQQMVEQHAEIFATLERLAGEASPPTVDFSARIRAWSNLVREHMRLEDDVLFQGAEVE